MLNDRTLGWIVAGLLLALVAPPLVLTIADEIATHNRAVAIEEMERALQAYDATSHRCGAFSNVRLVRDYSRPTSGYWIPVLPHPCL